MNKEIEDLKKRIEEGRIQQEDVRTILDYINYALTDYLTGLPNARALQFRLEEELDWSNRHKLPFSYFLFDVNNLKKLNDYYGHNKGDEYIKLAASFLRENKRISDFIARRSGGESKSDEFSMLCRETNSTDSREILTRLKVKACDYSIKVKKTIIPLSIGIGFGIYNPGDNLEKTIEDADISLYLDKKQTKMEV